MKQKVIFIIALTILAIFGFKPKNNDKGPQRKSYNCENKSKIHFLERIYELPEITGNIKKTIEEKHYNYLNEITPVKNQIKEKKARLNTLLYEDTVDKEKINNLVNSIGNLKTKLLKKKTEHRINIANVLPYKAKILFKRNASKYLMKNRGKFKRHHQRKHQSCNCKCR